MRPDQEPARSPADPGYGAIQEGASAEASPEPPVAAVEAQFSAFVGPLPHPALLEHYDAVLPGAAERILALAEKQSAHRMRMESQAAAHELWRSWAGLAAGIGIALAFLGAAIGLIVSGHEEAGTALGILDLLALAVSFVLSQRGERTPPSLPRGQEDGDRTVSVEGRVS